jgi:hypothetical protein
VGDGTATKKPAEAGYGADCQWLEGRNRMRYIIAAMVACLLVACSGLPPAPANTCSTKYECEIEMYQRAR